MTKEVAPAISKAEIEKKIKRYEDRLHALSKRYEWTLSAEEKRSKLTLHFILDKLKRKLARVSSSLQINESDSDSDRRTMAEVSPQTTSPEHAEHSDATHAESPDHTEEIAPLPPDGGTVTNPKAFNFNISSGLFQGLALMLFFSACTKWYISLQHRRR